MGKHFGRSKRYFLRDETGCGELTGGKGFGTEEKGGGRKRCVWNINRCVDINVCVNFDVCVIDSGMFEESSHRVFCCSSVMIGVVSLWLLAMVGINVNSDREIKWSSAAVVLLSLSPVVLISFCKSSPSLSAKRLLFTITFCFLFFCLPCLIARVAVWKLWDFGCQRHVWISASADLQQDAMRYAS